MPSSAPLCPNLTFNAQMCPRTLQCTTIICSNCTLQYATMPLLYPPIYQYASSLHSIPLCGPLYPPVYPYAPTPSPSLPLRSHIPVCLLTDRFSTTANSVTLSVFFLIIPWSFPCPLKIKERADSNEPAKNFCVSNFELCQ